MYLRLMRSTIWVNVQVRSLNINYHVEIRGLHSSRSIVGLIVAFGNDLPGFLHVTLGLCLRFLGIESILAENLNTPVRAFKPSRILGYGRWMAGYKLE